MRFTHLLSCALLGFAATSAQASSISITGPLEWSVGSGGNGHYYELVSRSGGWDEAVADAATRTHLGRTGHLATITSADEQAFVFSNILGDTNAWLGASDSDTEGDWQWITGEAWSYENFDPVHRRDNATGFEASFDYLLMWGFGAGGDGHWRDAPFGMSHYIAEYAPATAAVPLPASLPLLLAGMGGLAVLRRRRSG